MIASRVAYNPDGPGRKVLSVEELNRVVAYIQSKEKHEGKTIDGPRFWNCTPLDFAFEIGRAAERYTAAPKGRGRPWSGQIAEHLVVAPASTVQLTDPERQTVERTILEKISPRSRAVLAWHIDKITGKLELHIISSNFIDGIPPALRITELRRSAPDNDYLFVLKDAVETAIQTIKAGAPEKFFPTVREATDEKARKVIAEALQFARPSDDIAEFLIALEAHGWRVRLGKKTVSIARPEDRKLLRFSFSDLQGWIRAHDVDRARDRDLKKQADKERPGNEPSP
jgi:hypothetical protein